MPELSTVNAVDYAMILLYFVIIIWVGVYSAGKNKGTEDYFKGGGQVPWFMAGVSNWVSGFSAFMFVAAAGYTYNNGTGAVLLFTSAFWAYLVGYFYFAPRWRRARIAAPLEFLTKRYSPSTTYFFTLCSIPIQVLGLAQGLYILAIFISAAVGLDVETFHLFGLELSGLQMTMLVVGIVMIVYSVIGGLWGAVLSDAVQGVVILVVSLMILPISLHYLGDGGMFAGFKRLLAELPRDYLVPSGQPTNPLFLGSYIFHIFLGYNVAWHLVQRYNSVPTERDARKMALLCAWLSLFGPLLWILPVMGSKLIFPHIGELWPNLQAPEEASFVSLAMLLLPHGMIGFVVAAILSATLGHANDAFNWLSASITKDVYVPLRRRVGLREASDHHQMRAAQVTMLIVGVLGVGFAFYIATLGGVFEFNLKYFSMVASGMLMPVFLGMVYRKTPWWSGIACVIASVSTTVTLFKLEVFAEHPFPRNVIGSALAATFVFFLSTFWYREDDPKSAGARQLDRDLRTPVEEEEAHTDPRQMQVYAMVGNVSWVLGLVLLGCIFLPATAVAPASINAVGAVLLFAIGWLLRRLAKVRVEQE
jgi:Na+/proline symporter